MSWERDCNGMGTLHGLGRLEILAEFYWGGQTKKNILRIGGRKIFKIMFKSSMEVSAG
jgi:hypothetical protein